MAVNKDTSLNVTATTPTAESGATTQEAVAKTSLMRFLREVMIELRKTNWPSWNDLVKFTTVVLGTIVIVAVFLWVAQLVVGQVFTYLFPALPSAG
jgi:preprotein translocase subunit SecE